MTEDFYDTGEQFPFARDEYRYSGAIDE